MHQALASDKTNPVFAPEPFTPNYQRSLYSSFRKLVRDRFNMLESTLGRLNPNVQELARKVLALEDQILACFAEVNQHRMSGEKIRVHGDYHLGQVLFTGSDFVIIDFEGEPGVSFNERRRKKSPLKDVAGMMRSIHYAAFGKILLSNTYAAAETELLEKWAEQWQHYANRYFLSAYMEAMNMDTPLSNQHEVLLLTLLLEKAIYELGYELNGRPDWTIIPLRGIDYLMQRYIDEKRAKEK
jgi:maltose alpha-D-glucosyltransferase/alpha-amylase